MRATSRPIWYGREWTGGGPIRHIGVHRVLSYNPIQPHQMPVHELAVVELGRLRLQLDDVQVTVSASQLVVIPPGTRIASVGEREANAGLFYWVGLDSSMLQAAAPGAVRADALALDGHLMRHARQTLQVDARLLAAIRSYFELIHRGQADAMQRYGAAWHLAGVLGAAMASPTCSAGAGLQRVMPAIELIRQQLASPPSVDELAARCGLSRVHFSRLFRGATGHTPRDYINQQRVEAARRMLEQPDATVSAVALKLGFSSSQYFATVFRKFTGRRPSDDREQPAV